MIQVLNATKKESLKNELRKDFPNLTETELNQIDQSVTDLVSSISQKIQQDETEVARVIDEKIDFINSKGI